jgi:hypothetical protein
MLAGTDLDVSACACETGTKGEGKHTMRCSLWKTIPAALLLLAVPSFALPHSTKTSSRHHDHASLKHASLKRGAAKHTEGESATGKHRTGLHLRALTHHDTHHGYDTVAMPTDRATQIQTALIKQGYMTGEPSGAWDASTVAAMQKLQGDNGWQTKITPDARALIKLGLGPKDNAPAGASPQDASQAAPQ